MLSAAENSVNNITSNVLEIQLHAFAHWFAPRQGGKYYFFVIFKTVPVVSFWLRKTWERQTHLFLDKTLQ